jgi:hypothetical protein
MPFFILRVDSTTEAVAKAQHEPHTPWLVAALVQMVLQSNLIIIIIDF